MQVQVSRYRWKLVAAGFALAVAVAAALATAAVGSGNPGPSAEIAALRQQVTQLKEDVKVHRAFASQLAVIGVQSRIAYIDGAGFHAMENVFKAGQIGNRDLSTVEKVLKVTSKIGWPDALAGKAATFRRDVQALEAALKANDAAKAYEAAKAVHESQHELSSGSYAWLS